MRLSKKQINTKKIKDEGQSPSSYPSEKYQMVPTIAALRRATQHTGDVLVAFVIHAFLINISKITAFFTMKNYDEHLLAQNAEKLSNQKR